MPDGDLPASPDARPWIRLPEPAERGIGPKCCPRCHAPVPGAERGDFFHACPRAEPGDASAAIARLQAERDAALMALAEEQERSRRLGHVVARAEAAAHRWRVRAAGKTVEAHNARRGFDLCPSLAQMDRFWTHRVRLR